MRRTRGSERRSARYVIIQRLAQDKASPTDHDSGQLTGLKKAIDGSSPYAQYFGCFLGREQNCRGRSLGNGAVNCPGPPVLSCRQGRNNLAWYGSVNADLIDTMQT